MHVLLGLRERRSLPAIARLTFLLLLLLSISAAAPSGVVPGSLVGAKPQELILAGLHPASLAARARQPTPQPKAAQVITKQDRASLQATGRPRTALSSSDQAEVHYFRGPRSGSMPVQVGEIRVPILIYHYLSANPNPRDKLRTGLSVEPNVFVRQCRYLADNGYTTITIDEYLAARAGKLKLPARPVILTFDDGYRDFYTNAYPILLRYQMRATIYIISDKIGQPTYMTWTQLRELAASPLITIGAHTRTHVALDAVPISRAQDEIATSRQILEEQLGIRIEHFCYPYGRYNETVRALVEAAGYLSATTTRRRIAVADDDPLLLPRLEITGATDMPQFRANLQLRHTRVPTLPRLPRRGSHPQ